MYSLWRGDVLLGRIHPELPGETANAVCGVLNPSADFLPGQTVFQHAMLDWPGTPVFHHFQSHAVAGAASEQRQVVRDGPRPLAEAIRDSVPIERQLSLRDATNAYVATSTIAIMATAHTGRSIQRKLNSGVTQSQPAEV